MSNITPTTLIENGKLTSSKMEDGTSVTGDLIGFTPNKYGRTDIQLLVDGEAVTVYPSGNLRFVEVDAKAGTKFKVGDTIQIVKVGKQTLKNGMVANKFTVNKATPSLTKQADQILAAAKTELTIEEKIAAAKARRTSLSNAAS